MAAWGARLQESMARIQKISGVYGLGVSTLTRARGRGRERKSERARARDREDPPSTLQ